MTNYGILLVDPNWSNDDAAQIEKAAFLRHKELIGADTLALIYLREPVDAVVAEAEITSEVIEHEAELIEQADQSALPVSKNPTVGVAHDFHVPLKLSRPMGPLTPPIPLERLKTILGPDFSVYDETWIPLSEAQFDQIVALWDTP